MDTTDCAINIKHLAHLLCDQLTEADLRDFDEMFRLRCSFDALGDLCRALSLALDDEYERTQKETIEANKRKDSHDTAGN